MSVFVKTQDSYKVRRAWGEVMLSAALALDKLPVIFDWLMPLWRTTGEPLIDSLLRSAPNDSSSQQLVLSRLQPVLVAFNSALDTFYQSTGLGATISSKLGSRGYPKYVSTSMFYVDYIHEYVIVHVLYVRMHAAALSCTWF